MNRALLNLAALAALLALAACGETNPSSNQRPFDAAGEGGGDFQGELLERSQERSGEMGPDETMTGSEGVTDTGEGVGFGPISG